jgi:hypothetical protein
MNHLEDWQKQLEEYRNDMALRKTMRLSFEQQLVVIKRQIHFNNKLVGLASGLLAVARAAENYLASPTEENRDDLEKALEELEAEE